MNENPSHDFEDRLARQTEAESDDAMSEDQLERMLTAAEAGLARKGGRVDKAGYFSFGDDVDTKDIARASQERAGEVPDSHEG